LCKAVVERRAVDREFVQQCAEGWNAFEASLKRLEWGSLERESGLKREQMARVGAMYANSKGTIFCWAMGVTHHANGVGNIHLIANLAIARGMIGRTGAGLLPLRGHSNVQGVGSVGVVPKLKAKMVEAMERELGVELPRSEGMDTMACMEHAREGGFDAGIFLGGNLYGASPDSTSAVEAIGKTGFVVYLNTTLNTGHAWGRGRETLILPVKTRDEESQVTTQESMFNYVRVSDGGPARHEGPRSEVEILADIGEQVVGDRGKLKWDEMRSHDKVRELIAKVVPGYGGAGMIGADKKEFYVEGRTFHERRFATESGKARVHVEELQPGAQLRENELRLMTMRSEGQFNTVVYEEEDIYRGVERRDVILRNEEDMRRMRLSADDLVTVRSEAGALMNVVVRSGKLRPGNAAMYYPEANVIVGRKVDARSKTPAFKNVVVQLEKQEARVNGGQGVKMSSELVATGSSRGNLKAC
ncbi:MAG TPA: molybdopterin dinucleotide binding domain-containing protein, partial [Phycisphaerales bacterium]|nr:molybdopterin dinucleotide binding domain-containing protein [Phycisphaerales bacterium]